MPPLSSSTRRTPPDRLERASNRLEMTSLPIPEATSAGVRTPFCGRQVAGTGRNWDRTPRIRLEDDARDGSSISTAEVRHHIDPCVFAHRPPLALAPDEPRLELVRQ